MPKFFYSPSVGRAPAVPEIAFFPVSSPPSVHQIAELAGRLWPHVPLSQIRLTPGVNCFYVSAGEAATEPVERDPASS